MVWGASIQQKLKYITATTFNNIPQFTFMIIFPVFIGIMLALPGFISTAKGNGHWKVDWAKLFGVGLPALYITTYPLIYYVVIPTVVGDMALGGYTRFFISNLFFDDILRTVSGLVLGYIILSVIQKPFGKLKEI